MFFVNFERGRGPWKHGTDPAAVLQKLSPFAKADKSGFLVQERALLAQVVHWNTPSSRFEPVPLYHAPSETAVVSWARIDNREELAEPLDISRASLDELSDSELILRSYLKWGEDCVRHLVGDFSFAIHDGKRKKVFCGRDHMGVRPLYYFLSPERFVCATNLPALIGSSGVPVEPDEQWICEYLCDLSMNFNLTPLKGIYKLPPAHCLRVTVENHQRRQYFHLSDVPELRLKNSGEYVEAYRERLETAIKCRLVSDYGIGAELSGGIDSSTITAYAAKFLGNELPRLHTFAFVLSELEPKYIEAVIRHCLLPNNHIFEEWEEDDQKMVERSLDILGCPVEHGIATSFEPFYRRAEELGIRTLLSGFGGDEFVTTTHGHLVLFEMIVAKRYGKLLHSLPGNVLLRLLRLVKMELKRRRTNNFTTPVYNANFYKAFKVRWSQRIVRDEPVSRYNLEQRYFEMARYDSGFANFKRFTMEKSWRPFGATRLEDCTLMAAGRRVEYRWPLLDIRLLRLFLSIPSEENYFRGMGRYLHRRAIRGILPEMVVWNPSKDMGAARRAGNNAVEQRLFVTSELHPIIKEYVDLEKLKKQINEVSSGKDSDPARANNAIFQVNRNIRKMARINAWMQYIVSIRRTVSMSQMDSP